MSTHHEAGLLAVQAHPPAENPICQFTSCSPVLVCLASSVADTVASLPSSQVQPVQDIIICWDKAFLAVVSGLAPGQVPVFSLSLRCMQ